MKIEEICSKKNIKLSLILMPGKSFVEQPGSISAQFQDYFRIKIVQNNERMNVNVIDLANSLRSNYQKQQGKWFYPNEGHLTAEGHRKAADILKPLINTTHSVMVDFR